MEVNEHEKPFNIGHKFK